MSTIKQHNIKNTKMTKKSEFNRRNFVAKALCTDSRFKTAVFKDKRRSCKHKIDYKDSKNW